VHELTNPTGMVVHGFTSAKQHSEADASVDLWLCCVDKNAKAHCMHCCLQASPVMCTCKLNIRCCKGRHRPLPDTLLPPRASNVQ